MPLSVQDRASRQKISKDLKDPNNVINKGDLDTSQTLYTDNKEQTSLCKCRKSHFLNADRTLTKLTID